MTRPRTALRRTPANYKFQITDVAMKFKINLATQPYENARRFFLLWGGGLAAALLLSAALVYGAASGWRNVHGVSQHIAAERANLDKLKAQESADLAILNQPENRSVREKSLVLNGLIRRKEFSWTLIFAEFERIMPARLHVLSITPQVNENNDIEVRLAVAGDSREKVIELLQRMEQSPEFRNPRVLTETNAAAHNMQSGDVIEFQITAIYVPRAPREPEETRGQ
jgi:hypothetical protein